MASKLERVLLCYHSNRSSTAIREAIFSGLDVRSLRTLRVASAHIKDLVDARAGQCFRDIYIKAPLGRTETTHQLAFLQAILPFCYNLIISLNQYCDDEDTATSRSTSESTLRSIFKRLGRSVEGEKTSRITPRVSMIDTLLSGNQKEQNLHDRRSWTKVFEACHQLRHLTIRIHGDPGWPGCTELETQLSQIRCALEEASMPTTPELHLTPVHAMGLMHLRWSSFGAFGSPMPTHPPPFIWHKLRDLEIQLRNPFAWDRLNETQTLQFKQLLYGYFRAFATTLQRLTFVYLDSEGPCPLTLHLQPELSHKAPLRWCELMELRLGNIIHPHETLENLTSLCPKLETVKMLRSQYRYSFANVAGRDDKWLVVRLIQRALVGERASSIYSQPELDAAYLSGVSTASREVPFVLDLGERDFRP